jgi:hypothetical protein
MARRLLGSTRSDYRALGVLFAAEFFPATGVEALTDPMASVANTAAFAFARSTDVRKRLVLVHRIQNFLHWAPERFSALLSLLGRSDSVMLRAIADDPNQHVYVRSEAFSALERLSETGLAESRPVMRRALAPVTAVYRKAS